MTKKSVLSIGINVTEDEKINIQKKLNSKNILLDFASIKDLFLKIVDGEIFASVLDKNFKNYDYIWIQSGWNTTHMAYLLHLYFKSKKIKHNRTNIHNTKQNLNWLVILPATTR